jgi:hypothetical protein
MYISEMIKRPRKARHQNFYNRLLFISLFSILECYLKDTVVFLVSFEIKNAYTIIEEIPSLKNKKIPLSDVQNLNITDKVINVLQNTSFHKFGDTDKYFSKILLKDFDLLNTFNEYVMTRHNTIHRNKRDINGNEIIITNDDLVSLLRKVSSKIAIIHTTIQGNILKFQDVTE